jgi:hypothetical protein
MARHSLPLVPALAAFALLIALGLLGWRAAALFSQASGDVARGPAETALYATLEPVAGKGHLRLALTRDAAGARTVFMLLDSASNADRAQLQGVAALAAGLSAEAGDRVIIEETAFASTSAVPGIAGWAELAALSGLALLSGLIWSVSLRTATTAPAAIPAIPAAPDAPLPRNDLTAARRPVAAAPPPSAAADLARTDPAGAADILREWMSGSGAEKVFGRVSGNSARDGRAQ